MDYGRDIDGMDEAGMDRQRQKEENAILQNITEKWNLTMMKCRNNLADTQKIRTKKKKKKEKT